MTAPARSYRNLRRGIELGFIDGWPLIYDGTEPVAIDAQPGKGKLTRFLGVNLVSPRTGHLSKIITDPKDGELAGVRARCAERQGVSARPAGGGDRASASKTSPHARPSTKSAGRSPLGCATALPSG